MAALAVAADLVHHPFFDAGEHSVNAKTHPVPNGTSPHDAPRELVRLFKLLADETRLRILLRLFERQELNVRALCDLLGQSQPAVSHHLALLKADGLIDCRHEGKHNFYRVLPDRWDTLVGMLCQAVPEGRFPLRFRQWVLSEARGEVNKSSGTEP